jgi:hypothetical protein
VFSYECVSEGDAVCNQTGAVDEHWVRPDLGIEGQIPELMAVSGRFDLSYYGSSAVTDYGSALPTEIVPVLPDEVRAVGGFSFRQPGTVAFLVRNPQGITVDFVHLTAAPVDDIELWCREQRVSTVELEAPGAETAAAVVPVDADGIHLAGALGYSWSSSDTDVLRIAAADSNLTPSAGAVVSDDEVRLVAMAEGQAELTVVLDELSATMTVTVGPEVTP